MAMDWKPLAAQLAQMGLPFLGRMLVGQIPIVGAILGPAVGEQIGQFAASRIAELLGVEATPEAIGKAIDEKPTTEVMAHLQAVQEEAQAKWPALAEIARTETEGEVEIAKANAETYLAVFRAEMGANHPWLSFYRTALNYGASAVFIGVLLMIVFAVANGGDLLSRVNSSADLLKYVLGAAAAILGVHFYTRGKEREAAATGQPVSGVAGAAAKIAKATAAPAPTPPPPKPRFARTD